MYVTLLDSRGTIRWVSGTIADLTPDDVIGRSAWQFASPAVAKELRNALQRSLEGDEVSHTATVIIGGRQRRFRSLWRLAEIEGGPFIVITTNEVQSEFRQLSDKQLDVLRCLLECNSNAETASVLGISERTVESHLRNIRKTLRIETRQGLIPFALQHLGPL